MIEQDVNKRSAISGVQSIEKGVNTNLTTGLEIVTATQSMNPTHHDPEHISQMCLDPSYDKGRSCNIRTQPVLTVCTSLSGIPSEDMDKSLIKRENQIGSGHRVQEFEKTGATG